jgi:hypothetical protein
VNVTVAAGTGPPSSVNTMPLKCRVTSGTGGTPLGADGCVRLQADATTTTKIMNRRFIGILLTDISDTFEGASRPPVASSTPNALSSRDRYPMAISEVPIPLRLDTLP